MVIKMGMIGMNEGNGHPFSFSSIINGYDPESLLASGWRNIHDYLQVRPKTEFGFADVRITHAWTPKRHWTQQLCQACHIPHAVSIPEEMLSAIDALIIARDDVQSHFQLALPFLKKGLPVFVDKPLTVDVNELIFFQPYLYSGQLMSCSAMRYAPEMDEIRYAPKEEKTWLLARGTGVNGWDQYGIHLLEALLPVHPSFPHTLTALDAGHESVAITMNDGTLLHIDTLGSTNKPAFHVEWWTKDEHFSVALKDHFTMFRRMLGDFIHSIRNEQPVLQVRETNTILRTLMAGRRSLNEKRKVLIDEINI